MKTNNTRQLKILKIYIFYKEYNAYLCPAEFEVWDYSEYNPTNLAKVMVTTETVSGVLTGAGLLISWESNTTVKTRCLLNQKNEQKVTPRDI